MGVVWTLPTMAKNGNLVRKNGGFLRFKTSDYSVGIPWICLVGDETTIWGCFFLLLKESYALCKSKLLNQLICRVFIKNDNPTTDLT